MTEAPGIFTYPNSQQAVAVNQDFSYNQDTPAAPGSYITFYITGAGGLLYGNQYYTDIGGVPPASPWATPQIPVLVQFGNGTPAPASFAGLTFAGVVQVNAQIPASAPTGNAVPIQVLFDNLAPPNASSPVATIRIQ